MERHAGIVVLIGSITNSDNALRIVAIAPPPHKPAYPGKRILENVRSAKRPVLR